MSFSDWDWPCAQRRADQGLEDTKKDSGERLNWNSERSCGDRYCVILSVCHTWGQRPMRKDLGGTLSKLVSAGRGMGPGIAGLWCWGKSRRQETLTLVSSQVLERWCMDELAAIQSSSRVGPCGMKGHCRISVTTSTVPPLIWVLWEQPDEWSKLAADSVVNGHTQECRSLPKTLPLFTPLLHLWFWVDHSLSFPPMIPWTDVICLWTISPT